MRVAVVYNKKDIYVEITPDKFVELLEKYFEEEKDLKKAMERITNEIKQLTRYK